MGARESSNWVFKTDPWSSAALVVSYGRADNALKNSFVLTLAAHFLVNLCVYYSSS